MFRLEQHSFSSRIYLQIEYKIFFYTSPNSIGFHIVKQDRIEVNIILIKDLDMIDGTPVLDIKAYFPIVGEGEEVRTGWVEGKLERFESMQADERFEK